MQTTRCGWTKLTVAGVLAEAAFTVVAQQANATILASDTFNSPHTTLGQLASQTSLTGGLTWSKSADAPGSPNPAVVTGGLDGDGVASYFANSSVPFTASLYKTFAITLDVKPVATFNNSIEDGGSWVGIEFGVNGANAYYDAPHAGGQLVAKLGVTGEWVLASGGHEYDLGFAQGTVSGFVYGDWYHMELAYDVPTSTVTLTIVDDSNPLINASDTVVQAISLSAITGAGFTDWYSSDTTAEFDNFQLDGTMIPEPSVGLLLGLGGLLCWQWRKQTV